MRSIPIFSIAVVVMTAGLLHSTTVFAKGHWSYEGETGPAFWGELSPKNLFCKQGKRQSPVNLQQDMVVAEGKESFEINYGETAVEVVNNGHTIQANLLEKNAVLKFSGKDYTLQQFHFHSPSEHAVNGALYPMEMHFVHISDDGKRVALGLLITKGEENTALVEMFKNLPQDNTIKYNTKIDLALLLPKDKTVFSYSGSLTTPPCTEEVRWLVARNHITLSEHQIDAFSKLYPNSNRPLQPLNDRKLSLH